ncbi:MAG: hypothetical protein DMG68_04320, partial [Acidobacteria bacterium]
IFLADDPQSFADAIVTFLRDEDARRHFEAAAAATARQYDWSVITERFVEVLQKTIDAAHATVSIPSAEPVGA